MFDFWSSLASVRKKFTDVFSSRSNTSASLGIATDGSKWTAINGIIQVVSGRAKSTTTPSLGAAGASYPMAVVSMPTANNTIDISDTLQGSSAALWVQSSTDWWMVSIDSTFNTIPGNVVYGATGSNYGITGTNYGVVGTNYATAGSNYGLTGTTYGVVGSNYVTTGSVYGINGTNYGTTGTNYGFAALLNQYIYPTNYASASSPNYSTNASRSATVTNWRSARVGNVTNFFPSTTINFFPGGFSIAGFTINYTSYSAGSTWGFNFGSAAAGSNYGAVGNNNGVIGSNYGVSGSNYGATVQTYGVTGSNFIASGSNYGSVGSNYGSVGSNYGATGTNAITYAYAQYLRIRQSSGSVVSTISSALISTAQTINSLRVQILGNTITAKGYSDNNFVTQIGSDLVHTATGITISTQFGIGISPSEYQQSDIIGSSVKITRI